MSDNITDLQAVRDRRRIYAEMDEEAALWNEICGRLRKIMAEMVELALPDDRAAPLIGSASIRRCEPPRRQGDDRQNSGYNWGLARPDNLGDERRQPLECVGLLGEALVAVVGRTDAGDGMTQASFAMIGQHSGAAHEAASGARARWLFQPNSLLEQDSASQVKSASPLNENRIPNFVRPLFGDEGEIVIAVQRNCACGTDCSSVVR
jgi:hypothetical protein